MSRNRRRAARGSQAFVAKSRLRVAGPNCMGAYSYRERLFGYPNTELCRLAPGSVACLFQSGGTIQFWMKSAAERGLRYSYCVTSGNEPDLGLADYLNFVIDDPETRQVVLFIEGIRRPEAFMHAAGRALAMGKPILAIKTGATAQSQAASQSHTGAIAGDYAAYLAMCERYGIVNYRSLDDLVEAALAFEGGRLPKGPRIGFVTTSGGTVDLLYDYAEAEGAAMPDFTDATKAALLPMMQEGIAPKNPLDVGIPSTLEVAGQDLRDRGARFQYRHGGLGLAHAAQDRCLGRRDAAATAADPDRQADRRVRAHDLPDQRQPPRRAGGRRAFHSCKGSSRPSAPSTACGFTPRAEAACRRRRHLHRPATSRRTRWTPRSRATASRCRKSRLVGNAAEAAAAAERIGFPVVLKIHSRDILHKTEAGGVALGLRDRAAVQAAADALAAAARAAQPDARIDGFLVQEMVSGVEAIVGARSDPLYGPMLLVGSGGVLVELAKDAALRLLPVSAAEVARDARPAQAGNASFRLSRPAGGRSRGARGDRARARPILSRSSRKNKGHRDQPAHGAPGR